MSTPNSRIQTCIASSAGRHLALQLPPVGPIRRRPYVALLTGLAFCLAVGAAVAFAARGWSGFSGDPSLTRERNEAQEVCERFIRLKNAGDADLAELLGRQPSVPTVALSQAELDRLQTDYFLHDSLRIRSLARADEQPSDPRDGIRFVLVTEGRVTAPTLSLKTRTGIERSGRTMLNPDLLVEVRQGKIYGYRAELHMGP